MICIFTAIATVLLFVAYAFIGAFRNLSKLDRQTRLAWAQVEWACSIRRRLAQELLSLNTTRQAPEFRRKALADALAFVAGADDPLSRQHAENDLDAALKVLLQDAAPEGSETQTLHEKLSAATLRIRAAQRFHNDQALVYNTKLSILPLALVARIGGLRPVELAP